MRSLIVLVFFILCSTTACASVLDFKIQPENPTKGDIVTIYGTADPSEEVKIDISFEKTVPVQSGDYTFSVSGVNIPEGKNRFTVTAYGCDNLKVSVRMFFNLVWITIGSDANNGVATVSQSNVPSGTYDVIIHGKSSQSSVKLKITATGYIKADENGNFRFSYDTSPIPPGDFVVSVGGLTRVVILAGSGGSPSPPGGSAGGGASVISTPTPNPIAAPTSTPSPTPTPMETLIVTPVVTTTPNQSPSLEQNSTQLPAGNLTQQVNDSKKRSFSVQIPGFELIAAIMSLAFVLASRRMKR